MNLSFKEKKINSRIHILPDSVKRKIAAGEVIDGPYSVVKELLENAIDAHATEIEIEVVESGLKRIVVHDNGIGIYKEDLPLAIEEHATSKISSIDDIFHISTMGFRGEALSSIAEVSTLTILSRCEDESIGGKLVVRDGKKEIFDWAGPKGTTVIVENLFYNTPARKKFLKGLKSELSAIKDVIFAIAIAHPEVTFKLKIDNQKIYTFQSTSTIERIAQIYGNEIASHLLYASINDIQCNIECFCSQPGYYRSNRSMQFLFVNRRYVQYQYLGVILHQTYQALLQKGQHPIAFIFCSIKPDLVDVNVHPAKKEIRFYDVQYFNSILYNGINKALNSTIYSLPLSKESFVSDNNEIKRNQTPIVNSDEAHTYTINNQIQIPYTLTEDRRSFIHAIQNLYTQLHNNYRVLGFIFGTYLLVEKDSVLYFIDIHAAHERKIFDYLMEMDTITTVQKLLIPVVIELSANELMTIQEYFPLLQKYGFSLEQFDETSIIVSSVPDFCTESDIETLVREILVDLEDNKNKIEDIKINIIKKIACHSAKKAHDDFTNDDIVAIIDYVFTTSNRRCPHGRPFVYALSQDELERYFKRT